MRNVEIKLPASLYDAMEKRVNELGGIGAGSDYRDYRASGECWCWYGILNSIDPSSGIAYNDGKLALFCSRIPITEPTEADVEWYQINYELSPKDAKYRADRYRSFFNRGANDDAARRCGLADTERVSWECYIEQREIVRDAEDTRTIEEIIQSVTRQEEPQPAAATD